MYDKNNIFAKIIKGDIPCDKVYEDTYAIAFKDINPKAPVHVVVIPKIECISFDDFVQNNSAQTVGAFFQSVHKTAHTLNLSDDGYRILSNHGLNASQEVPHFHVHILGGKPLGGLLP